MFIEECPRCGDSHIVENIAIFENAFRLPVIAGVVATHWTTCRKSQDPIYLNVQVLQDTIGFARSVEDEEATDA